jgi:hypothetical protein
MTTILRPDEPVTVETDSKGKRTKRTFPNSHKAKAAYVKDAKAGKEPKVVKPTTSKSDAKGKKKESARDRFGNRVGTQAAMINAKIGSTPKKASAIADATGFPVGRIRDHLKWLVARKHVVETKDHEFKTK